MLQVIELSNGKRYGTSGKDQLELFAYAIDKLRETGCNVRILTGKQVKEVLE